MKKELKKKEIEVKKPKRKENEEIDIKKPKNSKKVKAKKTKKKKRVFLRIIVLLILAAIVFFAARFAIKMRENGSGLQGFLTTALGQDPLQEVDKMTVLLIGESDGLTDTLILCSYDPMNNTANMLSIPRDTFTGNNKNAATANYKINAAYNIGNKNPQKTVDAVSKVTGVEIPYYILVDTKAVVKLVDTLGGVTFNVPMDMKYDDSSQKLYINLKKGEQVIYGKEAEWLLRFRHNNNGSTYPEEYGQEDIGRMRTQREFIQAAITQAIKPQNIIKIPQFLDIAFENVKTNIPLDSMKPYIPHMSNFKTENIRSEMLPGGSELCNGVWLYIHNKTQTQALVNELFPKEIEETEDVGNTTNSTTNTSSSNTAKTNTTNSTTNKNSQIKIEILNGTSNKEALSKLTDKLKSAGYTVSKTGNTSNTSKTTIINRKSVADTAIADIKGIVEVGNISAGTDNANVNVTIIIGNDYK